MINKCMSSSAVPSRPEKEKLLEVKRKKRNPLFSHVTSWGKRKKKKTFSYHRGVQCVPFPVGANTSVRINS